MTVQFSKIVKSLVTLSRGFFFLFFFLLFSLQLFLRISANGSFSRYLCSVRMRENADQNDSECGHFLRSINQSMVFKTRNSAEQLFLKILQIYKEKPVIWSTFSILTLLQCGASVIKEIVTCIFLRSSGKYPRGCFWVLNE